MFLEATESLYFPEQRLFLEISVRTLIVDKGFCQKIA